MQRLEIVVAMDVAIDDILAQVADRCYPIIPILFWATNRHRAPAPFGPENKRWMRRAYHHTDMVMGPTQEIPHPHARVMLDERVKDRSGVPVARLSGSVHPETLRSARFLRARAGEWLKAAGGMQIESDGACIACCESADRAFLS
jgi:hypothetical protein